MRLSGSFPSGVFAPSKGISVPSWAQPSAPLFSIFLSLRGLRGSRRKATVRQKHPFPRGLFGREVPNTREAHQTGYRCTSKYSSRARSRRLMHRWTQQVVERPRSCQRKRRHVRWVCKSKCPPLWIRDRGFWNTHDLASLGDVGSDKRTAVGGTTLRVSKAKRKSRLCP